MRIHSNSIENKIGFDKIRSSAEALCRMESAKRRVQDIEFSYDFEQVDQSLTVTDEMRVILMMETGFPDSGFVDTSYFLKYLEAESYIIDIQSVSKLKNSLETLRLITLFFKNKRDSSYPALRELTKPIALFPEVARRIDSIIDRFGSIKDNASEDLQLIRRALKDTEGSISKKITSVLKKAQSEGIVDEDATVSVRDGRMLIPVQAHNKRKLPGFVLDESASGKTLYIEPIEIVELNNQVKELRFAEQREIVKILKEFTDFLRPYQPELLISAEILSEIDFITAKALLASKMQAGKPILTKERELVLRNARHPILEATLKKERKEIVPLNLSLNKDKRILLISGPNAGGKSVCLKTVGLLQYMVQCGFLIPALENSELPLFKTIFIDIGDEQSIENDLSTYSSHLKNMNSIIERADDRSLILIDEFGSGTEPTAGGAIAEAILQEIEKRGSMGIITTHYSNLKFYASSSNSVINGGMQFDVQNIQPLFKLEIGVPGSSFAFELAKKMGLPEELIKTAEEKAGTEFVDLEKHLKKIARNRKAWEERLAKIKTTDKTLESITDKYQKELTDIQKLRKSIIEEAKEEAAGMLADANRKIESTIKEIRESQADKEKTRLIRKELAEFAAEAGKEVDNANEEKIVRKMEQLQRRKEKREEKRQSREVQKGDGGVSAGSAIKGGAPLKDKGAPVKKGDKVRIEGGDLIGEVLSLDGNSANLAMGSVMIRQPLSRIEKISENEYKEIAKKLNSGRITIHESEDVIKRRQNFSPTIDIRGERLEQALNIVISFIDDAIMVGVSEVRILHGKGNGILREEIRKYLKTIGGVASFRDEQIEMGGSGITVVKLDD